VYNAVFGELDSKSNTGFFDISLVASFWNFMWAVCSCFFHGIVLLSLICFAFMLSHAHIIQV